jgi:hypothetical protein
VTRIEPALSAWEPHSRVRGGRSTCGTPGTGRPVVTAPARPAELSEATTTRSSVRPDNHQGNLCAWLVPERLTTRLVTTSADNDLVLSGRVKDCIEKPLTLLVVHPASVVGPL